MQNMQNMQNMQHFISEGGYGGKCVPELSPAVDGDMLIPASDTVLIAADGAIKIAPRGTTYEGYSDVESDEYALGKLADGKGGWTYPPTPDATSALNWQLSAALAAKGLGFVPVDPIVAARWQYEPSFTIDGVVAKALATSLGYDDARLQTLFNEAAAL